MVSARWRANDQSNLMFAYFAGTATSLGNIPPLLPLPTGSSIAPFRFVPMSLAMNSVSSASRYRRYQSPGDIGMIRKWVTVLELTCLSAETLLVTGVPRRRCRHQGQIRRSSAPAASGQVAFTLSAHGTKLPIPNVRFSAAVGVGADIVQTSRRRRD